MTLCHSARAHAYVDWMFWEEKSCAWWRLGTVHTDTAAIHILLLTCINTERLHTRVREREPHHMSKDPSLNISMEDTTGSLATDASAFVRRSSRRSQKHEFAVGDHVVIHEVRKARPTRKRFLSPGAFSCASQLVFLSFSLLHFVSL
jgi:hypothetical protein